MMYRSAVLSDCPAIYQRVCEMEEKQLPYEPFAEIFQAQLNDAQYVCLVCEEAGRLLGFLNLRLEAQLHHAARVAEILEFAVAPDARGAGVGHGLFQEACRTAAQAGCCQIEVACNCLRERTHRFYAREGMKRFHYRFSKSLTGETPEENRLGQ